LAATIPPAVGAHEFRVGVFVLLGILAFMTVLFLMTDPATFRGRYMVTTSVEDASGIRRGDPVQMRGVNIGRVHRFDMEGDGVDITLEIEGEWEIPADSRADLVATGLLGGVTVDVKRGTAAQVLRDGGRLPGRSASGLMGSVDELTGQAETVLGQIQSLLSDSTVDAVEASAVQLQALLTDLSALTRSQSGEIAQLTQSLNRSANAVEGAAPEAREALVEARAMMTRLNQTSETLERAMGSLEEVVGRIAQGRGTLGRLSQDEELYQNLSAAAASARLLLDDLRENPGRYIKLSVF